MKEGYIETAGGNPTSQELQAINRLARRNLSPDEVFVFSVVLCDNEIDRDFERFSDEALEAMAKLYEGKTGIFDHSMKGRDQVARILTCEVEKPEGQTTTYGAPYVRIKARAYMPRTESNKDMITEIDAGIKKEVSVGCSMGRVICSVCGANQRAGGCEHQKGKTYRLHGNDVICHHVLSLPTDAYEWSFVAVPAQRNAGVVKAFIHQEKGGENNLPQALIKSLQQGGQVILSALDAATLAEYICSLEKSAKDGQAHRQRTLEETVRLAGLAQPQLAGELLTKMLGRLNYQELWRVHQAFQAQVDCLMPPVSQFEPMASENPKAKPEFDTFMI